MAISTAAKVGSGLALTSAGVVGSTIAYKYATSLYSIEKIALEEGKWTVSKIETTAGTTDEGGKKKLTVSLKISKTKDENNNWSCTLVATTSKTSDSNIEADTSAINNSLKVFFGDSINVVSAATSSPLDPIKTNYKEGFISSCSANRKDKPEPNNNKVESEINISLEESGTTNKYKFKESDLKEVFEGKWGKSKSESSKQVSK